MTQEELGVLLSCRLSGITNAVARLEGVGALKGHRGRVVSGIEPGSNCSLGVRMASQKANTVACCTRLSERVGFVGATAMPDRACQQSDVRTPNSTRI